MFSYEFYEIYKNTFSYETPPVATSISLLLGFHLINKKVKPHPKQFKDWLSNQIAKL